MKFHISKYHRRKSVFLLQSRRVAPSFHVNSSVPVCLLPTLQFSMAEKSKSLRGLVLFVQFKILTLGVPLCNFMCFTPQSLGHTKVPRMLARITNDSYLLGFSEVL